MIASTKSLIRYPKVSDWLCFLPGERIMVRTGKVEIGQRVNTALAAIVAEELNVDPVCMEFAPVDTDTSLDEEYTSASDSLQVSGNSLRHAAATARAYLFDLAADALGIHREDLDVREGVVSSKNSNQHVSYWQLLNGYQIDEAVREELPLKDPADYRIIGRGTKARDLSELIAGECPFVQDLVFPGMLHARLVRPPHYHARIKDIAPLESATLNGGELVRNGSFLAVAHEDEYTCEVIAERVRSRTTWDMNGGIDDKNVHEQLVQRDRISLPVEQGAAIEAPVPPLKPAPAQASFTFEQTFSKPYIMHGSIGPSAAAAQFQDGQLTIWTHTQGVFPLRETIAESLGMNPENVRLIHVRGAGCYGHNGADDAALEAGIIAKAIPSVPILLKYTREDEHAWEPYGPAMVVQMRASIDADGNIIDWSHETFSDTHRTRPRPGPEKCGPGRMISTRLLSQPIEPFVPQPFLSAPLAGVHRNATPYYNIHEPRVVKNLVRNMPLRTSTLRTLGSYMNVLAIEATIDALAEAAVIDPLEFRLRNLEDPRAKDVLNAVARASNWGKDEKQDGHGRGLSFVRYNNLKAYAAVVFDLQVDDAANVYLNKATIAADAGQIVDPEGLKLQLEGAVIQAASWTLYEEVTYDRDGITSRDWDTYSIIRFDNIPDIEVILIDRPGEPFLGASECAVAPAGAAIVSAIYDAIGLRLTHLPFTPSKIKLAALQ